MRSTRSPEGCPFELSPDITGITFSGVHAEYTQADTWYPSWAEDGSLYSPWTDGTVVDSCSSDSRSPLNADRGGMTGTGQGRIRGDDPLALDIEDLGIEYASPAPYGGRYPCGSLVHNGVWYYGTYCLDETNRGLNWDILGPFVGFRVSTDMGRSWEDTPHTPSAPLFGESGKQGSKVRLGAPHFVDFGRNMANSPDGLAYLVGHGATDPDSNLAWIAGDQAYMARVSPSVETINDAARYEFFGGVDYRGDPVWTHDIGSARPLIEWKGKVGHITMTYVASLRKYLLCITDGWPTIGTMNTYFLESDHLTGPWRLVTLLEQFGEQGYFVNIPSKFISSDGMTMWLCYSANFTNGYLGTSFRSDPPGSRYGMCLQQIHLELG